MRHITDTVLQECFSISPLFSLMCSIRATPVPALIDSGAAPNLISEKLVHFLHLQKRKLQKPTEILPITGPSVIIQHFVRVYLYIENARFRLTLRVMNMDIPLILGRPFLIQTNPIINWRSRTITFDVNGKLIIQPLFSNGVFCKTSSQTDRCQN